MAQHCGCADMHLTYLHFFFLLLHVLFSTNIAILFPLACMLVGIVKAWNFFQRGFSMLLLLLWATSCIVGLRVLTFFIFIWGRFPVIHICVWVLCFLHIHCRMAFGKHLSPESVHRCCSVVGADLFVVGDNVVDVHFDCTHVTAMTIYCVVVVVFSFFFFFVVVCSARCRIVLVGASQGKTRSAWIRRWGQR